MIISRTPLRISFCGGGTDLPNFYEEAGCGAVVSTSINKYIYINVNRKFDGMVRASYSVTEIVGSALELKHEADPRGAGCDRSSRRHRDHLDRRHSLPREPAWEAPACSRWGC